MRQLGLIAMRVLEGGNNRMSQEQTTDLRLTPKAKRYIIAAIHSYITWLRTEEPFTASREDLELDITYGETLTKVIETWPVKEAP